MNFAVSSNEPIETFEFDGLTFTIINGNSTNNDKPYWNVKDECQKTETTFGQSKEILSDINIDNNTKVRNGFLTLTCNPFLPGIKPKINKTEENDLTLNSPPYAENREPYVGSPDISLLKKPRILKKIPNRLLRINKNEVKKAKI